MAVTFSAPLMDAKHFTSSIIKAQPAFRLTAGRFQKNRMFTDEISTFSKARYALAAAAFHLKHPEQQNTVLLPAYHCPALVEPFIYAGYNIVFYPQLADLSSDLAFFNSLLSHDVTHVVVVRYFGFSQNAELLMRSAHNAGIKVIEDNAHSLTHFWRTCASKPVEVSASVSSLSKTLGTVDGGVLYLPGYHAHIQKPDVVTELKALLTGFRPAKAQGETSADLRYFYPGMERADCLRASRWLMHNSDYAAMSKRRRDNYQYLANGLQNSPLGAVMYPELTEDDVPYVLPFLLNNIDGFATLRQQKIQALRWEEIALEVTDSMTDYRQLLVQLPLHQDLSHSELESIISAIT